MHDLTPTTNSRLSELTGRLLHSFTTLILIAITACLSICPLNNAVFADNRSVPNIVLILADDLGYGDVGCYNPESRIPTPNLNRLAKQGMRFTDAHSPCTVCTPTRYSLMTGQMAFRVPKGGSVFTGAGGPSLIAADRLTLPKMLQWVKWRSGVFLTTTSPLSRQGQFPVFTGVRLSRTGRPPFHCLSGSPLVHKGGCLIE